MTKIERMQQVFAHEMALKDARISELEKEIAVLRKEIADLSHGESNLSHGESK